MQNTWLLHEWGKARLAMTSQRTNQADAVALGVSLGEELKERRATIAKEVKRNLRVCVHVWLDSYMHMFV